METRALVLLLSIASAAVACGTGEAPVQRPPVDIRRAPSVAAGDQPPLRPSAQAAALQQPLTLRARQTLYVPVYSHVYWGPKPKPLNLACTLSIRNIDPKVPITITAVDYYDTEGALIGHYLESNVTLGPLETTEYYVKERDTTGGSGANFIVIWEAQEPVNVPIVEAIMIGIHSQQGISFIAESREIIE